MTRGLRTVDLAARYRERRAAVDVWFAAHAATTPAPLYASADVRDAGFKAAPVDLNLFPAGYNNLHPHYYAAAVEAWRLELERAFPGVTSICIIPESHTRNLHYLQNVTTLHGLLLDAGYAPSIATVDPKFVNPETALVDASGTPLTLYTAERQGDTLVVNGAAPDLLLLNNDLADGVPEALQGLAQPVAPPPSLGWHARHKGEHAAHYGRLAAEWAAVLDVDPWVVTPRTEVVADVDFHEPETFGPLVDTVDQVIAHTAAKYAEHGVDATPYCFIKDDAGTYGMGIITARSGADVAGLNRKQRNKMDRGKANAIITRVLVQEGIPTSASIDGAEAEPVLYAVGERIIGGFSRYHPTRAPGESLNARGALFTDLIGEGPAAGALEDDPMLDLYAGLTRIALLAAGHEIRDHTAAP